MIALVTISTTIYASFPVTEDGTELVAADNNSSELPISPYVDWPLFIVCLLVGGLGIHRFMLGQPGLGVLMLLTAGGCGIWALIDLINIAMGNMSR